MKKLLVLIACAWTISMHAMEVNEQSARAFVIYKGIKQLIMNPPVFAYPGLQTRQATSGCAIFYNDFVCK